MSYKEEFGTVDLLIQSNKTTRGVDAFSLALIKTERQIRKLFTHLIYQYPKIQEESFNDIRNALFENRKVYFEGFIRGFDSIYPVKINRLVGKEYEKLLNEVKESIKIRNKVFHGQLTNKKLTTKNLLDFTNNLSTWCMLLSNGAKEELGYDGFERNSLRRSNLDLYSRYLINMNSLEDYRKFIETLLARNYYVK